MGRIKAESDDPEPELRPEGRAAQEIDSAGNARRQPLTSDAEGVIKPVVM
ncbi:MAG TPA: hypothetical protein VKA70_08660 [Blastocatellia bacterium]|nr:hypothetical protein [Blastocatellia bacterium]